MTDSTTLSPTPMRAPMWHCVSDPALARDICTSLHADRSAMVDAEVVKRAPDATLDDPADNEMSGRQEARAGSEGASPAKTDLNLDVRDPWSESLRGVVRNNPLATLVGAFTLGALMARMTQAGAT